MKILFISRAHPPIVGGMENQNYELFRWLSKSAAVKIVANRRGKIFLPLFFFQAATYSLLFSGKYEVVLLGDGVLGIIGWIIKIFYPQKPIICVVHGLDLTYNVRFYQKLWVKCFLKKMDLFIAVGNETIRAGVARGLAENKFVFIPNGIDTKKYFSKNYGRQDLEKILELNLDNKKVILTFGRLVKRKGVAWFINNVMPKLPPNVLYVIAGDGPDKNNIITSVQQNKLEDRVKILGYVSNNVRDILLNTCDIFVQPNIKVKGDMEGFGISVIEAAFCKIPVIASRLEGLSDAIKDGQNGFLVESENPEAWNVKIRELLADDNFRKNFGEKAHKFVIENYSWEKVSQLYLTEIKNNLTYV